jgi:pimeloyl-ACP methyl ester carboxylesterase
MSFRLIIAVATLFLFSIGASTAQKVDYPYPVEYMNLSLEGQQAQMAYMDVQPAKPNGQTIILFHGKNFSGFYWKDVIPYLTDAGYRVIVPDQIGWGRSSKPNIHYSFHGLANNNLLLLDSLKIDKVVVVGHSMGGMLATRFSIMYPGRVSKLVIENMIGLEDYASIVPYKPITASYQKELQGTYESYKKYQQTYYPVWKDEYEIYVKAQAESLADPDFKSIAWVNALTYQMIYEQPVVYEFEKLKMPALLIIGQADRTVVGKDALTDEQKKVYGNYPALGKMLHRRIRNSRLVELLGVGHIPHIQTPALFKKHLLRFLTASSQSYK